MNARYSIGIDLGTTNSVVAFCPLDAPDDLQLMKIPQLVQPGQIEARDSLPSFLYLPRESEVESLRTAYNSDPAGGVVGAYARSQAAENPQRVVVAAKSWLCHSSVGRTDAVLPWQSPPEVNKVSAYECTVRFLSHLVAAWNEQHTDAPLREQQVVLTVPASFAPAARELTRQAAVAAGLPETFVLLEEPQAAVYRWLSAQGDDWRQTLRADDVMLVVDVGGGTTDLTLVSVSQKDGELNLERLAVGNHLLLGGDNMDLALAHFASTKFAESGHDLDPWQSVALWHACRDAKEQLLSADGPEQQTVSVLGRGSSLIGGTISAEIGKAETQRLIVEGFFPKCDAAARPEHNAASGFQDIGLPYEADAAVTKHVAAFLAAQSGDDSAASVTPTHVLFNGGVFRSETLRTRMLDTLNSWYDDDPVVLGGLDDLDTSVAMGAAYYGFSKQSGGIRIRGGTARSYYVGIETAGLAIPGVPRPLRALCVAARGMEEGTETEVPSEEVGIVVGKPAQFRFFSSAVRLDDQAGSKLDRWSPEEVVEIEPITVHLTSESTSGEAFIPVKFASRITELGMFELWCHSTRGDEKWKMEFNAREAAK
ncbi:heat-shock chaperone protein [Rhodopirellula maiorica SM1]|uniref:Heat-shock chaperone protein n=1 Tax=Rhodopirellula maiorica SM1 TaxID=1265738 RepID=M5RJH0_9BACT|nr:Hsp70 family protein [Rhodopirellula maiorica]EMI15527.1 heat-shock chaperone protein [Rhodopirellula maiorica SM1]